MTRVSRLIVVLVATFVDRRHADLTITQQIQKEGPPQTRT